MPKKLYVGNLPFSTTEEAVRNLFSQYGEVSSVNIITDKMTGRPRGFCFVEMENADDAIAALNNQQFEGRTLNVNVAQERPQGGGRSGGGFGGGGHRGGGRDRDNRGGGGNRDRW